MKLTLALLLVAPSAFGATGAPSFSTPVIWASHGGPFTDGRAQYADVSGDGRKDLVYEGGCTPGGATHCFWVALSSGSGFSAHAQWLGLAVPAAFVKGQAQYADLNGDGRADLIYQLDAAGPANQFLVALSNGQTFGTPSVWVTHGGPFEPGRAQFADVNADGKKDLIYEGGCPAGDPATHCFWVSRSTGTTFTPPTRWVSHGGPGGITRGQAQYADVNGDGRADLIYQALDNRFWVSVSTGYNFSSPVVWVAHGGTFEASRAQYPDLNGDGKKDLAFEGGCPAGSPATHCFWISLSIGTSFKSPELWFGHGGPATFYPGQAAYADFNRDGRADQIFQGVDNRFWVLPSTGTGFGPPTVGVSEPGTLVPGQAQYAELNADGATDLIFQDTAAGGTSTRFWVSTVSLPPDPELDSFETELRSSLQASTMSADDKIRHTLGRLGYGPNPDAVAALKLLSPDTNEAIIRYLKDQLALVDQTVIANGSEDPFVLQQLAAIPTCTTPDVFNDGVSATIPRAAMCNVLDFDETQLNAFFAYFNKVMYDCVDNTPACPYSGAERAVQVERLTVLRHSIANAVFNQLLYRKALLASRSKAGLREVLTDFWFNHFNVSAEVVWQFPVLTFENEIRSHLGRSFYDMLLDTSRSRAMLLYLGQAENKYGANLPLEGLNENYSREVMELHTLGLNSEYSRTLTAQGQSYTQIEIRNAARAISGWNMPELFGPTFWNYVFMPENYDGAHAKSFTSPMFFGPSFPSGLTIQAGSACNVSPCDARVSDGELFLTMLSQATATANTISEKLVQRFVFDDSQSSLQAYKALRDRMVSKFLEYGIDPGKRDRQLRAVYYKLFASPEFWSVGQALGAKYKTPFEWMVSAVRVLPTNGFTYADFLSSSKSSLYNEATGCGAWAPETTFINAYLGDSDHTTYRYPFPTGFSAENAYWISSKSLVARSRFLFNAPDLSASGLLPPPCSGPSCKIPFVAASNPSSNDLILAVGTKLLGRAPRADTLSAVGTAVSSYVTTGNFWAADESPADTTYYVTRDAYAAVLSFLLLSPEMAVK